MVSIHVVPTLGDIPSRPALQVLQFMVQSNVLSVYLIHILRSELRTLLV